MSFQHLIFLSSSDCEALSLKELLSKTDDESFRMWNNLKLGYTESQGHTVLHDEVARLYESIHPENVLITTPEEGVFIAMNCML